jgi:hypothetical protein
MKRNAEGLYEVSKFVCALNDTITATGATREEAKANLKKAKAEYRAGNPIEISGSFRSPGFVVRGPVGNRTYEYDADRKGYLWARRDLAKHLREERKPE